MGKQTALVATRNDEADFLQFLRSRWNIRIFRPNAPSREEIWLDEFPVYGPRLCQLFLWNCEFPWEPEFGVCEHEAGEAAGWAYVRNAFDAPAIEFDRTNEDRYFTKDLPHIFYGRIYWGNTGEYDRVSCGRWYEAVVRWVRKQGHRVQKGYRWETRPFYLPDAWRRREKIVSSA